MARKSIKTDLPNNKHIRMAITEAIADLHEKHEESISKVLAESDGDSITITYTCLLDVNDSKPTLKVRQRYSQTVTDVRNCELDDPKQITFVESLGKVGKHELEKEEALGESENEVVKEIGKPAKGKKEKAKSKGKGKSKKNAVPENVTALGTEYVGETA